MQGKAWLQVGGLALAGGALNCYSPELALDLDLAENAAVLLSMLPCRRGGDPGAGSAGEEKRWAATMGGGGWIIGGDDFRLGICLG